MDNEIDWIINAINVLSFMIGIENLNKNDEQVKQLQNHLLEQDKQYKEIIKILKEMQDGRK